MSDLLNRDTILNRASQKREAAVMAFGGRLRVVELDAASRDAMDLFVARLQKERGEDAVRQYTSSLWVMYSVVDADGKRIFSDEDLEAVLRLPGRDLRRVFRAASDVNGLAEADEGDEGN